MICSAAVPVYTLYSLLTPHWLLKGRVDFNCLWFTCVLCSYLFFSCVFSDLVCDVRVVLVFVPYVCVLRVAFVSIMELIEYCAPCMVSFLCGLYLNMTRISFSWSSEGDSNGNGICRSSQLPLTDRICGDLFVDKVGTACGGV